MIIANLIQHLDSGALFVGVSKETGRRYITAADESGVQHFINHVVVHEGIDENGQPIAKKVNGSKVYKWVKGKACTPRNIVAM